MTGSHSNSNLSLPSHVASLTLLMSLPLPAAVAHGFPTVGCEVGGAADGEVVVGQDGGRGGSGLG
jgi:hypothetical protein